MARLRGILADTRPLQNPHFRRLFWANVVTVIGAQLTIVSVPAQIYADTGSSAYVGLTGLFGLVPLVVFGLYGGALADRFDKRMLLIVTTWGLIVTSGLFAFQAFLDNTNVWLLLGLFSLQQAFFAVNQPTRTAVLPTILPPERLPAANSLNMTVMNFGGIAGPLIAGALIPFIGFAWLYSVDTITLFATLFAVIALPALPPHDTGSEPSTTARGSVWEGLRYLSGHPVLLMSFVVDLVAMIFGMPRALFPELAHTSFAGPQEGGLAFALLFAAIPAGSVIGGVFSGWVNRVQRQGRVIVLAITAWGIGVTVFGVAAAMAGGDRERALPWLIVGVFALAFGGAADIASGALRQTILQSAATPAVRGRLQGVFIVVVAGGPRIADVLHGGTADLLDRTALATTPAISGAVLATVSGGLLVILGMLVCALWGRAFWRYHPGRQAHV